MEVITMNFSTARAAACRNSIPGFPVGATHSNTPLSIKGSGTG